MVGYYINCLGEKTGMMRTLQMNFLFNFSKKSRINKIKHENNKSFNKLHQGLVLNDVQIKIKNNYKYFKSIVIFTEIVRINIINRIKLNKFSFEEYVEHPA